MAMNTPELDMDEVESIYVKHKTKFYFGICGVCYKHPNQTAVERDLFMSCIAKQFDIICTNTVAYFRLIGDFNDR